MSHQDIALLAGAFEIVVGMLAFGWLVQSGARIFEAIIDWKISKVEKKCDG